MISIICSDAGGAEIISSWLYLKKIDFKATLYGPAKKIFKSKFPNLKNINYKINIKNSQILITGTSVSRIELNSIEYAKINNKKVITILDNWTDYKFRFSKNNKQILPDEIWTTDIYSYNMANKFFKKTKIKLKKNYYIAYLKKKFEESEIILKKNKVVFVSTPIKKTALLKYKNINHYGYNEDHIMKYFLNNFIKNNKRFSDIHIQLHPSENKKAYKNLISAEKKLKIKVDYNKKLFDNIKDANLIVGSNSMALVIAKLALKKKVINILPLSQKNTIPYKSIKEHRFKIR